MSEILSQFRSKIDHFWNGLSPTVTIATDDVRKMVNHVAELESELKEVWFLKNPQGRTIAAFENETLAEEARLKAAENHAHAYWWTIENMKVQGE